MRHATLPADAGIGSNDRDALDRAVRADNRATSEKPAKPPSGVIKSPMTRKGYYRLKPGVDAGVTSGD